MNVGIDQISFHVPNFYVDMVDLANARNVDPNKFLIGIGQEKMAVNPKSQDIITFATNAAKQILTDDDLNKIDLIIVGTESSIDESKAAAVVLHRLLDIQPFARSFEVKEACYAGTAGLQMALNHVRLHPDKKALVIATDIAKYGLNSGGEPTQGAGAVAILVAANPKILVIHEESLALTQDIYDFWRPTNQAYPLVDGPLSNETYIQSFNQVWNTYNQQFNQQISDYQALLFHIPYTKMGKKALQSVLPTADQITQERLLQHYEDSIQYSRQVGNLYTGSLYLGLISLLENSQDLKTTQKIGLFSYGSGAVAEFFTASLVNGYQEHLHHSLHQNLLNERKRLSIEEYEKMFEDSLDVNVDQEFSDTYPYSIQSIHNTIRQYRK
ncbi:MAG TPA: hydroxymethylglutaryl-CoA synthase [Enterococcus columbae]|nr:hydroxymethylglutaryl-CoA synthase [Enterococcus columbae]